MYSVMGNENARNSSLQQDCPRAKKSKTDNDATQTALIAPKSSWECLPAVILDSIFQNLNFKDSINASSTCNHWRQSLYHPRKWQDVNFVIQPDSIPKAQYLRKHTAHIVVNATVRFNSINTGCVREFLLLMKCFACNNHLKLLAIEPSHSSIEIPENYTRNVDASPLHRIFVDILSRHSLSTISLGCNEELFEYLPDLLALVDEKKAHGVDTLALATVKEDPCNYLMQSVNTQQLRTFQRLQILSVDYDNLNDDVLNALTYADDFKRLVVHVHGIWDKHPGTSEGAWLKLRERHAACRLRLSFIHSIDEVKHMHSKVLKNNMPLSHLKVLFCEQMNLMVLAMLPDYRCTFESLMWIDNFANIDSETFVKEEHNDFDQAANELVIMAWLCTLLKELVFIGYKFYEWDWIGIVKLRADSLKRLEVANRDLILCGVKNLKDMNYVFGKSWSPLSDAELHPSIVDASAMAETDEYLMPIVLADLK